MSPEEVARAYEIFAQGETETAERLRNEGLDEAAKMLETYGSRTALLHLKRQELATSEQEPSPRATLDPPRDWSRCHWCGCEVGKRYSGDHAENCPGPLIRAASDLTAKEGREATR